MCSASVAYLPFDSAQPPIPALLAPLHRLAVVVVKGEISKAIGVHLWQAGGAALVRGGVLTVTEGSSIARSSTSSDGVRSFSARDLEANQARRHIARMYVGVDFHDWACFHGQGGGAIFVAGGVVTISNSSAILDTFSKVK